MRHPILCIVGPTATGKTAIALQISKVIPSLIISADSRQVYIGMDIGTGKDYPSDGTKIHLMDVVQPDEEWSVAHFLDSIVPLIHKAWEHHLLPIVVGGTGMYMQALLGEYETISVPQNTELRSQLNIMSAIELQNLLQKKDKKKWERMNVSDRNNPRRLVRAIEIADAKHEEKKQKQVPFPEADFLWIGLRAPLESLQKKIEERVYARIKQGMENEVRQLIQRYPDWSGNAWSATGYRETKQLLERTLSKQDYIHLWSLREFQYAKRQYTWFNKRKHIEWFDVLDSNVGNNVEKRVQSWYDDAYVTAH